MCYVCYSDREVRVPCFCLILSLECDCPVLPEPRPEPRVPHGLGDPGSLDDDLGISHSRLGDAPSQGARRIMGRRCAWRPYAPICARFCALSRALRTFSSSDSSSRHRCSASAMRSCAGSTVSGAASIFSVRRRSAPRRWMRSATTHEDDRPRLPKAGKGAVF